MLNRTLSAFSLIVSVFFGGCGDAGDEEGAGDDGDTLPKPTLEGLCDSDRGPFSLEIDNPWFPLPVGRVAFMEGMDEGALVDVTMTVLDETFDVNGVETRVLEEHERENGETVEISRNFFAQAPDGTVCYFGEEVDIYEDGAIASHDGAWLASDSGAEAGIIMPANPEPDMVYAQEHAPGVAEDHAEHVSEGDEVTVPAGTYTDTQSVREFTPLEPGHFSDKVYARGIGMIRDDVLELVSVEGAQ
jgi:hypothetical protein